MRPAMLYGSERVWPRQKNQERQIHFAEMRMLRWACGWTRLDRDYRIRPPMDSEEEGKRPRGAPKKRWRDVNKKA
ncbi:hypothetical protein TELCIR_12848 [Teladorsagia circumcincta]|uniref:Uncharacterized protein n=1 Tax=Teladorsagia circumcincta TaxID=45464 RepID=A0A2G9U7K3_TELCI|nr:hypothetical protein TELCIR_12848 [Teladorsagia circumcincta]